MKSVLRSSSPSSTASDSEIDRHQRSSIVLEALPWNCLFAASCDFDFGGSATTAAMERSGINLPGATSFSIATLLRASHNEAAIFCFLWSLTLLIPGSCLQGSADCSLALKPTRC